MIRSLRATLHPTWYQGHRKRAPYFEGWYYKLVDASEQHRFAVIPGIFKAANSGESHAFVQVLDGSTGEGTYHEYPLRAFAAAKDELDVHIGPNHFEPDSISLQVECPERTMAGHLHFSGVSPWPVTVVSPGAMGWYAWVPLMQTYHGVVSLDHVIHGSLTVDGRAIDFSDGRGYIEKDWGRSFPDAWIWMQTNHFERPGTSFTASIATIPWLGTSFRGFIVGLWHAGRLYRFATYTGAQIEALFIGDEGFHAVISDQSHRLEVAARRAPGGVLRGPTGGDMGGRVPESLRATVTLRLSALGDGTAPLVFAGTGRNAGLEVVGERSQLVERDLSDVGLLRSTLESLPQQPMDAFQDSWLQPLCS
ncbi:MAG: tocopherol cyclase family protein [Anaerolineae bacterium]|jgi:hypothetical protein